MIPEIMQHYGYNRLSINEVEEIEKRSLGMRRACVLFSAAFLIENSFLTVLCFRGNLWNENSSDTIMISAKVVFLALSVMSAFTTVYFCKTCFSAKGSLWEKICCCATPQKVVSSSTTPTARLSSSPRTQPTLSPGVQATSPLLSDAPLSTTLPSPKNSDSAHGSLPTISSSFVPRPSSHTRSSSHSHNMPASISLKSPRSPLDPLESL